MFDIQLIREDKKAALEGLRKKNSTADLDVIAAKDQSRRKLQQQADELRAKQNAANDEIAKLLKEKKQPKEQLAEMKKISEKIDDLEGKLKALKNELDGLLIGIPNVPHASVPVGGAEKNQVVRSWGKKPPADFKLKSHVELCESLDIVDFKRGTKISGSNFILYKGMGSRLVRALVNFMLDIHTSEHGYTEMFPPVLVNRESMTGTGQLPKMEEDMYKLKDEDLFLIPTAEVPITNVHRDEILKEEDLPIMYTAYSQCFRREAGSYGKDTKGLIRIHQFDKVELVKFVRPEHSYDELEKLVANAEMIFQRLNIPYRVTLLASGDLSFAAAKCYDLEVYAAGSDKWLEASSCSNFEAFQARRANIRFKGNTTKKPTHVHTLNGSGVALPRTMIALIENNQTQDGSVVIPEALRPYMGGLERIGKKG